MLGGYGGSVTPDPISNSEVKPSYADDTAPLRGGKVGRCQAFFILKLFVPVPNPMMCGVKPRCLIDSFNRQFTANTITIH